MTKNLPCLVKVIFFSFRHGYELVTNVLYYVLVAIVGCEYVLVEVLKTSLKQNKHYQNSVSGKNLKIKCKKTPKYQLLVSFKSHKKTW